MRSLLVKGLSGVVLYAGGGCMTRLDGDRCTDLGS